MKRISRLIAVAGALTFAITGILSAQGRSAATRPAHPTVMAHPMNAQPSPSEQRDFFHGIATKLGTTSDALESSYQAAKQANPKLTRGQFVSANMVAHNLGSKHPAITTQAILSGLQSGKSLGATLQGLGLSQQEAEDAERPKSLGAGRSGRGDVAERAEELLGGMGKRR